ncbi:MAG: hypothetical protein ACTTH9_08290, partial [Porphyromonas gingivalis]
EALERSSESEFLSWSMVQFVLYIMEICLVVISMKNYMRHTYIIREPVCTTTSAVEAFLDR